MEPDAELASEFQRAQRLGMGAAEEETRGEGELLGLHEGNFARYQIKPSEFKAWGEIWNQ